MKNLLTLAAVFFAFSVLFSMSRKLSERREKETSFQNTVNKMDFYETRTFTHEEFGFILDRLQNQSNDSHIDLAGVSYQFSSSGDASFEYRLERVAQYTLYIKPDTVTTDFTVTKRWWSKLLAWYCYW